MRWRHSAKPRNVNGGQKDGRQKNGGWEDEARRGWDANGCTFRVKRHRSASPCNPSFCPPFFCPNPESRRKCCLRPPALRVHHFVIWKWSSTSCPLFRLFHCSCRSDQFGKCTSLVSGMPVVQFVRSHDYLPVPCFSPVAPGCLWQRRSPCGSVGKCIAHWMRALPVSLLRDITPSHIPRKSRV